MSNIWQDYTYCVTEMILKKGRKLSIIFIVAEKIYEVFKIKRAFMYYLD